MRFFNLFKILFGLAFLFFLIGILGFIIVIVEVFEVLINTHSSLALKFILFLALVASFITILLYLKTKIRDLRR